ncbi:MAG: translation elongation factor 4 [Candidatus Moranbacteria bacterium]|nr:translation elongation factor 4 [Candidatus Moranbacteria bacterium]
MASMDQDNIRNFCIIAHIDHGKSTLADRLLEFTGTIEKRKMKEQILDQMDLERERGITIKLQPVRMIYNVQNVKGDQVEQLERAKRSYILNLIDTPGHVDFNYEVSRSLAAVEGAILLVDATKGVQAQTLSNLYLAIEQGLEIIPVINKIDLSNANIEKTKREVIHILGCQENEILLASGKTGEGVEEILQAVIRKIPVPKGNSDRSLRALIFDSKYDVYKGVLAYARIVDGSVRQEDGIYMMATATESSVIEVGYFKPELVVAEVLSAGDIGYIATGLKSVNQCRVGDTITISKSNVKNQISKLPGYKEVKPMVYASFYPVEGDDYNMMRDALEKLKLNDAAFVFELESNLALGRGFRCGFLGILHMEIIQSRLEREFEISPTITTPSVVYKIKTKDQSSSLEANHPSAEKSKTREFFIYSPAEMPDPSIIESISEPYVKLDIISPVSFLGPIMEVMKNTRAEYKNTEYIDSERIILNFNCPLTDVIVNLHDDLKSASSGYASMNYEFLEYRPNDLIKLDILVAGDKVDAFSRIVPKNRSYSEGKRIVEKLKEAIPKQNFTVALQAAVGGKIIARETIAAFRKDVTAKLYGGDVTRKRKLLEKQKKGKKKMKNIGRVTIPSEAFLAVLKK